MMQGVKELLLKLTTNERDLPVKLAKLDIKKAVAEGRVSMDDINFLVDLRDGRDPTKSGLDNQQLIDLTRSKATKIFGQRAGRVFGWGYVEVWDHMLSEYSKNHPVRLNLDSGSSPE